MKNSEIFFENADIEFWLENGILHEVYKKDTMLTAENAKVMVQARLDLCKGKSYPVFIDVTNLKSIDKGARAYFSKGDGTALITAGAFQLKKVVHKVMANFFIHFDRPKVPLSFFSSKEKALNWLESYKYK